MSTRLFPFLIAICAVAQTPQAAPARGSVSGVVRDSITGTPVRDVTLTAFRGEKRFATSRSDAQGQFAFKDLESGSVRIAAGGTQASVAADKYVDLPAGQEVILDVRVPPRTSIAGRVTDQNSEPVPNLDVLLIARDYQYGELRNIVAGFGATDADGQYKMIYALPGRVYFLLVRRREQNVDAISEAPADPKNRKPAIMPTYYPGTDSFQGAELISLKPGEQREHVDIRVQRTPSFCVEGVLGSGQPQSFQLTEHEPEVGRIGGTGFIVNPFSGKTDGDGKIRICDLHPGAYDLKVRQIQGTTTPFYAVLRVNIADRDAAVSVLGQPQIPVHGEIVWADGKTDPSGTQVNLEVATLEGVSFPGELGRTPVDVPGKFSFDHLMMKDYALNFVDNLPSGVYLKDIAFAGRTILYEALRPGTVVGAAELRITLARDGGTIGIAVTDKDGKPAPDMNIALIPDSALTEAALAASMLTGKTSQNGTWTSPALAPGKYFAIATQFLIDRSPESITRLSRAKSKAKGLDLGPGQSAQVAITSDDVPQ